VLRSRGRPGISLCLTTSGSLVNAALLLRDHSARVRDNLSLRGSLRHVWENSKRRLLEGGPIAPVIPSPGAEPSDSTGPMRSMAARFRFLPSLGRGLGRPDRFVGSILAATAKPGRPWIRRCAMSRMLSRGNKVNCQRACIGPPTVEISCQRAHDRGLALRPSGRMVVGAVAEGARGQGQSRAIRNDAAGPLFGDRCHSFWHF
jgi:hypothetical protein